MPATSATTALPSSPASIPGTSAASSPRRSRRPTGIAARSGSSGLGQGRHPVSLLPVGDRPSPPLLPRGHRLDVHGLLGLQLLRGQPGYESPRLAGGPAAPHH